MDKTTIKHLMYMPLLGLGLYGGYRGERFLRNRIKIIKQFVVPSLLAQTNKNFILWISVRREDKHNKQIKELKEYFDTITDFKTVITFAGVCFYDDKYEDKIARERLIDALQGSMGDLINAIGECSHVLMTIQPSDDIYSINAIKILQTAFKESDFEGSGFKNGYIWNMRTKEVREYNPQTNPPFYTIKMPRDVFIDPLAHARFTGLKKAVGKYKEGTPIPSHEYVGDAVNYKQIDERGFLVGCHLDNISTGFDNPYAGDKVSGVLKEFGLENTEPLKVDFSLGRYILSKLPHKVKRKLRWWAGEKQWIFRPLFAIIYNILRS